MLVTFVFCYLFRENNTSSCSALCCRFTLHAQICLCSVQYWIKCCGFDLVVKCFQCSHNRHALHTENHQWIVCTGIHFHFVCFVYSSSIRLRKRTIFVCVNFAFKWQTQHSRNANDAWAKKRIHKIESDVNRECICDLDYCARIDVP